MARSFPLYKKWKAFVRQLFWQLNRVINCRWICLWLVSLFLKTKKSQNVSFYRKRLLYFTLQEVYESFNESLCTGAFFQQLNRVIHFRWNWIWLSLSLLNDGEKVPKRIILSKSIVIVFYTTCMRVSMSLFRAFW